MNVVSAIVEGLAVVVGVALVAIVAFGVAVVAIPIILVLGAAAVIGICINEIINEHRAR